MAELQLPSGTVRVVQYGHPGQGKTNFVLQNANIPSLRDVGVYRDPAMLGTWDGDTFYSDQQLYNGEEEPVSERYDDARHVLGAYIRDALEGSDDVKRVWYNVDRDGPMGGVSTQVAGYMELEDGAIAPFAINIYSDHNIERAMQARLDEEERQRELRERLDS